MKLDVRDIFARKSQQSPAIDCPISLEDITKNARQAVKNGEQARSALQKANDAIVSKMNMDAASSVVMGPIKKEERIIQKAIARYDGDVTQVSDVVRSRVRIDSPAQVKHIKDLLGSQEFRKSLREKGVEILSVEDSFAAPKDTGWRGIVLKTEIDLGKGRSQKAETIFIPRGWFEDYETTHTYLENIRALKDMAKAQGRDLTSKEAKQVENYKAMARETHAELAARDGYDALVTRKPDTPAIGPTPEAVFH